VRGGEREKTRKRVEREDDKRRERRQEEKGHRRFNSRRSPPVYKYVVC
jgi:hypothetical protein